jgi:hypothetical protein
MNIIFKIVISLSIIGFVWTNITEEVQPHKNNIKYIYNMNIYGTTDESQRVVIKPGELDMGGNKIINVKNPTQVNDAATAGYVSNFVSHLNNSKVEWAGGTMTGDLSMGNHKLTNISTPEDAGDAATKHYVDNKGYNSDIYALGRYIIFPTQNNKKYFSVRTTKNINLTNDLLVNIENNLVDSAENEYKYHPRIQITSDLTLMPNPDKKIGLYAIKHRT